MMNISVSDIIERAKEVTDSYYLYFLLLDSRVVYVGQTKCVESRVQQHLNIGRDFDSYSSFEIFNQIPNEIEAEYIVQFNPEGNKSLPKNDTYILESKVGFDVSNCEPSFERCGKRWFKKPDLFKAVCVGVAKLKEQSK